MTIIFDILLFAFLVFIVLQDTKRGFLCSSVGFARAIIAIIITIFISSLFASKLNQSLIYPRVYQSIYNAIATAGATSVETVTQALPVAFQGIALLCGIDVKKIVASSETGYENYAKALAAPISNGLSAAIAFIFILIVVYLGLKLLVPLVSKFIHKIPFVGFVDTVGGFVFGVFHAFVWGWALATGFGFLLSLLGFSIESTVLIRFLSDFSPIKLIMWIFL